MPDEGRLNMGKYGIEIRFKEDLDLDKEKQLVKRFKEIMKEENIEYLKIWTWLTK